MSKNQPFFSIIIPSFNQGRYLDDCISSIINQKYTSWEIIVIDGGSTDNSLNVIQKYSKYIKYWQSEPDGGQSNAINIGLAHSSGRLVGWLNSDDIFYEDCLEKISKKYSKKFSIYYNRNIDIIDKDGKFLRKACMGKADKKSIINNNNTIIQPGSFYDAEIMRNIGGVDKNLKYSMDLDLWIRLLRFGEACECGGEYSFSAYREWEDTKTLTGGLYLCQERLEMLKKHGISKMSKAFLKIVFNIIRIKISGVKK